MSTNCNNGINISTLPAEPCNGEYISTDCSVSPSANITLDLPEGATQTEINAAITTALIYKEQQIQAIDGSETIVEAGDNITVEGSGTTLNPYIVNSTVTITDVSSIVSGIVNNTSLQELGGVDKLINIVRVGKGAGIDNGHDSNTVLGENSLGLNTTGSQNTAIGFYTLIANTIGLRNTAVGNEALSVNTAGENNTAVGTFALISNTIGNDNVALGASALLSSVSSNSNTAIGTSALHNTQFGQRNVSVGFNTTYRNETGDNNTAIGSTALEFNISGSNNISVGKDAGSRISPSGNVTVAEDSVFIGVNTRTTADSQSNQIIIGNDAVGAGSNTATLGNTSITKTVLRGTINAANLQVFADNTAAITGGLVVGDMYRTSTGILMVRF